MLKRLQFKNWRSLRDVTIDDLTPITVFIGANSSGKTNIVEAMRFTRYAVTRGVVEAAFAFQNVGGIHTLGIPEGEDTMLNYQFQKNDQTILDYSLELRFFEMWLSEFSSSVQYSKNGELLKEEMQSSIKNYAVQRSAAKDSRKIAGERLIDVQPPSVQFIAGSINRWQILAENFMPALARSNANIEQMGYLYTLDPLAENMLFILDFMRQTSPKIAEQLEQDAAWLLKHLETVRTSRSDYETRVSIHEKRLPSIDAPTISSGTARLIAMLTSHYVLDTLNAHLPGLVVIEEPDTALNPGILRRFVELLRTYVGGENPRQFILTTHNPAFLDLFKPEEVRIVSRGDDGFTKVERVPDHIHDIWLEEYGLGEVWTTNAFGGLAE